MEEKLDYHYGNEKLMAKHGSVADGRFQIGRHSYGCVVLTPALNLQSSTLALLEEYVKQGGRLISIGPLPKLVDGSESQVSLPGVQVVDTVAAAVTKIRKQYPENQDRRQAYE